MKHLRNKIKLAAIMMAVALFFTACAPKANTASGEKKQFRVGMECGYAPFNWTQLDDSNGAVRLSDNTYAGGYDVEIAKLVAEKLGMELVIVKTEWDGLPPSLTSGKIDAIIAGMSVKPERLETIDFTDSYYASDLVIVVRKDSPYASALALADFSGAKITGQLSTLHYDVIDQIPGVAKQPAMEDFPTMAISVSSGKIDGYVSERPGAKAAAATNPKLTFVSFEDGKGFDYSDNEVSVAIGIAKNSPLKEDINKALATISQEDRERLMEQAILNQPLEAA